MDPTDRLTAPPAGPMPPMTRGVSDTTVIVNGRRLLPGFNGPTATRAPTPPISSLRSGSTNSASVSTSSASNLSASTGLPPSQVIALARDAMKNSLESENQVAEAGAVGASLKPGVTVDLSRRNIQKIPEEVVDIVKNDLERYVLCPPPLHARCPPARGGSETSTRERLFSDIPPPFRLALSHNQISSLPVRFSECTSLRYLNIRANQISEFPMPVRWYSS